MKKQNYIYYEHIYGEVYYIKCNINEVKQDSISYLKYDFKEGNLQHEILENIKNEKIFIAKYIFKVNKKIIELWLKFFGKRLLKKYKNGIDTSFLHLFKNYYIVNYILIKKLETLTFENNELKFIKV